MERHGIVDPPDRNHTWVLFGYVLNLELPLEAGEARSITLTENPRLADQEIEMRVVREERRDTRGAEYIIQLHGLHEDFRLEVDLQSRTGAIKQQIQVRHGGPFDHLRLDKRYVH